MIYFFISFPPRSLHNTGYVFEERGEMEIKGKGLMVTHFLIGYDDDAAGSRDNHAHEFDHTHPDENVGHDPVINQSDEAGWSAGR